MISTGEQVWFFGTATGRNVCDSFSAVYCDDLCLMNGIVVAVNEKRDWVHVYVDGDKNIYCFGYTYFHTDVYLSRRDAIESMILRVKGFEND